MIYFDTSVIILTFDPDDPRYSKAQELLKKGGVISDLALAELVSYISRNFSSENPLAYALALLQKLNLRVESLIDSEYLPLVGSINRIIGLALKISKNLRLRTLDLLHVAYAASLNKIGIDTLVTADHEFVKAEKFLKENGISLVIIS